MVFDRASGITGWNHFQCQNWALHNVCVCIHGDHDHLKGRGEDAVIVGWFVSFFAPRVSQGSGGMDLLTFASAG